MGTAMIANGILDGQSSQHLTYSLQTEPLLHADESSATTATMATSTENSSSTQVLLTLDEASECMQNMSDTSCHIPEDTTNLLEESDLQSSGHSSDISNQLQESGDANAVLSTDNYIHIGVHHLNNDSVHTCLGNPQTKLDESYSS